MGLSKMFEVMVSIEGHIVGWDGEIEVGLVGFIGEMQCSM